MAKAIIFDMDGVIIDSEPLHHQSEQTLLSGYGVTVSDEELQSFAGKDARQLLTGFIEQYHLDTDFDSLYNQHVANIERVFYTSPIPTTNAIPLIKAINKRGIPLALASSSHRRLIELVLVRLNLSDYFDVIISGDEIDRGKPFPDIYIEAARRLGLSPRSCIAIEDSTNGVQAAKEAGCFCVGYKNPNSGKQDLGRADKIITDFSSFSIDQLLQWSEKHGSYIKTTGE